MPTPVTDPEELRRRAGLNRRGVAGYIADKASAEATAALKELHLADYTVLYEGARARLAEVLGYTDGRLARQGQQNSA